MSPTADRGPVDVFVAVGTDHHPFDRLVTWTDRWASEHPDLRVLVQRGESAAPTHADSEVMFGYDEVIALMTGARIVVAQGGPATMMDARSVGHRPVVVPRHGTLGEHVDDHQVRFSAWMADRDLIHLADDEDTYRSMLDRAAADADAFRIPPDAGGVDDTLAAFATLVDPLVVAGRRRRTRKGRR